MDNNLNNDSTNKKDDLENEKEDNNEVANETFFTKELDLSEKAFKFNVYKKGKNLRKQLTKLRNNFSNFLYHLSLDSQNNNQKPNYFTKTNFQPSTKNKLEIKIPNPNNSITLNANKNNKLKRKALTMPKTKNESTINNKSKSDKQKSLFKSVQFRTNNLNKLYGYNKRFYKFKDNLKKNKDSELEKYQEDILRLSSLNLCRDNLLRLYTDLRNLRINSEEVKPLPPINFRSLINHSLENRKKVKTKGFMPKNKRFKDMDEYEKELYKIKVNSKHEKMRANNKFLYRMYEILPEHLVEKMYVKKQKF
jgi:hypothetical protein